MRIQRIIFLVLVFSVMIGNPSAAPHGEGGEAGTGITGQVVETMDAGSYTYVRVKTASGEVWAAGPQTAVAVGDVVGFGKGAPMTNFHSPSLDRTFESIEFVGAITVLSGSGANDGEEGVGADETGVGCVSVVNSNDIARLGSYLLEPARRGLIALMMVNDAGGGPSVAPWGGVEPLLSTNPVAAGIPESV